MGKILNILNMESLSPEDNDLTGGTASSRKLAAKHARKRAEDDAKLLANRIALLKAEEQKAWKKIEETRNRANQIMKLRQRNAETTQAKLSRRHEIDQEIMEKQNQNRSIKDQQKLAVEQAKNQYKYKLCTDVDNMRNTQAHQKAQITMQKQEDVIKNTATKVAIKQSQKEWEARRRKIDEEKRLKAKMEVENKIMQENRLRLQREADIAKMEQEELELIQKLQNTQLMQRSAYEDLEAALANYNPPSTNKN